MKEFNALDYGCPACPAKEGQWCDREWPMANLFIQTMGFTHEQRTTYNLLANQPEDGEVPDKDEFDAAVLRVGRI